ncbi:hypothetical protein [Petrimonas sulfuriphila]|uniref:hypothetical protein n=1 Tax=Petrimonas sulfuriphila TaxID=285070 RepID=UPI003EBF9BE1
METKNITELEKTIVDVIFNYGNEYDGKKYMSFGDLADDSGLADARILRGVVSSLSKKGVIEIEKDFFTKGDTALFLSSEYSND